MRKFDRVRSRSLAATSRLCRLLGAVPGRRVLSAVFFATLLAGLSDRAFGDEGMWLFNNPPLKQFKEKYNFEPRPQWLEHLQKASVRFNSGGSGSFISPNRIKINNHQLRLQKMQKKSSRKKK